METGRALEQAPEERRVLVANDEPDLIDRHRRALQEAASLTDAQLLYVGDGRAPRRLAESALQRSAAQARTRRHFLDRIGDHVVPLQPSLPLRNQAVAVTELGYAAIETVLAALGACMTGTFAAQATARGVRIDSLTVDLECTIDLNGFFGIQPIRPGLSDVTLSYRVASDADEETLQEILDAARSLSPVFDTVTKPVAVAATLQKES